MTTYVNAQDLALHEFDVDRAGTLNDADAVTAASRRLYKDTPRGLSLAPLDRDGKHFTVFGQTAFGVQVSGIVEGTNIEASTDLMFPFTDDQIRVAIEEVEQQLAYAEEEHNEDDEGTTTAFQDFEIISANGETEHGYNLYTPVYGETFLGNFPSVGAAAHEAVRLGAESLNTIRVL